MAGQLTAVIAADAVSYNHDEECAGNVGCASLNGGPHLTNVGRCGPLTHRAETSSRGPRRDLRGCVEQTTCFRPVLSPVKLQVRTANTFA